MSSSRWIFAVLLLAACTQPERATDPAPPLAVDEVALQTALAQALAEGGAEVSGDEAIEIDVVTVEISVLGMT